MSGKKRMAVWAASVMAVATGVATFAFGGSSAQALDSETLRSMLIPASRQMAGTRLSMEAIPVQDAAKALQLDKVSYSPASCNNLEISLHGVGNHLGWVQSGVRPGFSGAKGGFSHTVVAIDGGVPQKLIREGAAACAKGKVTFDSTVTGTIGFTEIAVPQVKGVTTFGYKESFSVPAAGNEKEKQVLTAFGLPVAGVACEPEVIYAATGDLLFEIVEPTAELAQQSLTQLESRVPDNADTSSTAG